MFQLEWLLPFLESTYCCRPFTYSVDSVVEDKQDLYLLHSNVRGNFGCTLKISNVRTSKISNVRTSEDFERTSEKFERTYV